MLQELSRSLAVNFNVIVSLFQSIVERVLNIIASSIRDSIEVIFDSVGLKKSDNLYIEISNDDSSNRLIIEFEDGVKTRLEVNFEELERYVKLQVDSCQNGHILRIESPYTDARSVVFMKFDELSDTGKLQEVLLHIIACSILAIFDGFIPSYPGVVFLPRDRLETLCNFTIPDYVNSELVEHIVSTLHDFANLHFIVDSIVLTRCRVRKGSRELSFFELEPWVQDTLLLLHVVKYKLTSYTMLIIDEPCLFTNNMYVKHTAKILVELVKHNVDVLLATSSTELVHEILRLINSEQIDEDREYLRESMSIYELDEKEFRDVTEVYLS